MPCFFALALIISHSCSLARAIIGRYARGHRRSSKLLRKTYHRSLFGGSIVLSSKRSSLALAPSAALVGHACPALHSLNAPHCAQGFDPVEARLDRHDLPRHRAHVPLVSDHGALCVSPPAALHCRPPAPLFFISINRSPSSAPLDVLARFPPSRDRAGAAPKKAQGVHTEFGMMSG